MAPEYLSFGFDNLRRMCLNIRSRNSKFQQVYSQSVRGCRLQNQPALLCTALLDNSRKVQGTYDFASIGPPHIAHSLVCRRVAGIAQQRNQHSGPQMLMAGAIHVHKAHQIYLVHTLYSLFGQFCPGIDQKSNICTRASTPGPGTAQLDSLNNFQGHLFVQGSNSLHMAA
jgi:hypothetical protein